MYLEISIFSIIASQLTCKMMDKYNKAFYSWISKKVREIPRGLKTKSKLKTGEVSPCTWPQSLGFNIRAITVNETIGPPVLDSGWNWHPCMKPDTLKIYILWSSGVGKRNLNYWQRWQRRLLLILGSKSREKFARRILNQRHSLIWIWVYIYNCLNCLKTPSQEIDYWNHLGW